MTEHERIWLEPAPGADEDYGRQWCQQNVWGDEATEYVRAALSNRPAQEPVAYTTIAELAQVRSGYYGRMQDDANDFGWSVPLYAAPQPSLSSQRGEDSTPSPVDHVVMNGDRGFMPKFALGDRVRKTKGASWQGRVVGFYATHMTPIGYAVESEREPGSVQIYPEAAIEAVAASEGSTDE